MTGLPPNLDFSACRGLALWNDLTGFFGIWEAIAIQEIVKKLPEGAQVAELGTFQGKSSVAIAAVLPPNGLLHCVDHFQSTLLRQGEKKPPIEVVVQGNLDALNRHLEQFGVKDRVQVYVGGTGEIAQRFQPDYFDLLFIDAGHDFKSVKSDIDNWYPKLKPGGFMVCDDYEPKWPGVMEAVSSFGGEGKEIAPSLWMHQKPS